jgi:hypothetical protein
MNDAALRAMLDAPSVIDVGSRVARLATAHFRDHGEALVAYCRHALAAGDTDAEVREFLLTGSMAFPPVDTPEGPIILTMGTLLSGDRRSWTRRPPRRTPTRGGSGVTAGVAEAGDGARDSRRAGARSVGRSGP